MADSLPGFAPREEQQHLAEAIYRTLENRDVLIGEAGTGTGKTFAYLVPALFSGQRIIISTGTRHLQDQLFHTDLPLIRRALNSPVNACLLKGRANYLCRHRLMRAMHHPALKGEDSQRHLRIISDWSGTTRHGDIAEVIAVPEDSMVWPFVVSNDDFCSRHESEDLRECFVHQARKRAQEADIVVINHHLLCADLSLKEQGFGELLPTADGFVIDEAHQLPAIAAQFFGQRVSSRQLLDLARDTEGEQLQEAPDFKELSQLARQLETGVRHFRLAFGIDPKRDAWVRVQDDPAVEREQERLSRVLCALHETLAEVAERGKGLESCHRRAAQHADNLKRFLANRADDDTIHWYETFRTGFGLNMTPLTVAVPFQRAMQSLEAAWIFTSATLAVGGDFSHFRHQLGLELSEELQVDSPFNYRSNALLYLPDALPEPHSAAYTRELIEAIIPVLEASRGRAFLLFTSHRAMREASSLLDGRIAYPVFMQGQMPKHEIIDAFQAVGNAVLLGTSSFWEGVDVRGEALSLVVIDKLPFSSPGDPVLSARIDHMKQAGGDPFFEFQIPQAALALKQGVGRLIRGVSDRGVLVLCDPRIRSRPYGEIFITSLPPMPITRELDEVKAFFAPDDAETQETQQ